MGLRFQLWLPWIESSLGFQEVRHDVEVAFDIWRGEDVIWLLPDFPRVVRFARLDGPGVCSTHVAIPSRRLNVIDVFHVWENGIVFGPGSMRRFPDSRIDGLVQEWLNVARGGQLSLCDPPASGTIEIPRIQGAGDTATITFEEVTLLLRSGSSLPAWQEGDDIVAEWPIRGSRVLSVFPDAASHEVRRQLQELPSCMRAIRWPPPLSPLFPITGGGLDELVGQQRMVDIARRSHRDPEGAFREAERVANPYITDAYTTQMRASIVPVWVQEGPDGALDVMVNQFGASGRSWGEVLMSVAGQEMLTRTVSVRRAWGVLGFFAMLLLDELKRGRLPQCAMCGRILQGKQQFCAPTDDIDCYRRRRTSRRQERAIRRRRGRAEG